MGRHILQYDAFLDSTFLAVYGVFHEDIYVYFLLVSIP
jgi:hypothetical protein